MARTARQKSESGFYHVMIRGIGKQILFEDNEDFNRFLITVKRYLREHEVQIHAYCMMENHVHMLIRDPQKELAVFMKKLEGNYAFYFNHKYERIGTLFQERYKSEPIDNDEYFAVVLRYILQNPLKAGICAVETYPWSSYSEIVKRREIIQTDFAEDFFGGKESLLEYILRENDDICMEPSPAPINDSRAKQIIHNRLHIESGTQLQSYEKNERDKALRILKENGLSIRQIERLTGINRGIVLKA